MYTALYRKWRPKLFSDIISQENIVLTLKNEVKCKKVSHAYIFTGPKGTGKTSCARILAKAVNCKNSKNGEPCCKCDVCKKIANSEMFDIVEIDGASNNGIDDVRNLRSEAMFVPAACSYRVYIIDEVHMLSVNAFNALLKILEEPPTYVIFILATTEILKVPQTIISRCQRFDFNRVKLEDISKRLKFIANSENMSAFPDALIEIAKIADGSMRDALSFLDKCSILAGNSNITQKLVSDALGIVSYDDMVELHNAIINKDYGKIVALLELFYETGKEVNRILNGLLNFYHNVMLSSFDIGKRLNADVFFDNLDDSSKKLSIDNVLKAIEELLQCFEKLKNSSNKKILLETAILRLAFIFSNNKKDDSEPKKIENILQKNNKKRGLIKNDEDDLNDTCKAHSPSKNFKNQPSNTGQDMQMISNSELKLLDCWQEILEELANIDESKMLCGFLAGSMAYVSGDKLYIDTKNSIVDKKILEKKSIITNIINTKTGNDYRVFIKKTNKAPILQHDKLKEFLEFAQKAGVEVEEK